MTPDSDILTPAVFLSRDRCSLNFHFWLPGPGDPCYFHLRESWISPFPLPSHSLQRASEQAKKKHTGLQLFNQSLRLHILISYFQAINRRPTAGFPPLQKISLLYPDSQQQKRFTEIDCQLVPREQCLPQNNRRKNEKSLLQG